MNEHSVSAPPIEGRLREAFEATTDCVLILDREFRVVYMNERAIELSQSPLEKVYGKTHWEAWPTSQGTEVERRYRLALETGEPQEFEVRYDDERMGAWLEIHAHPTESGLSVFYRDVSARVREKEELLRLTEESDRQRRFYETILGTTPDLVYVFDRDHNFVYVNNALLSMWGRTLEDSLGKNCLQLGYEPWHAEMHDREIDQVVATKRAIRGVVPFNGTNGRRMYDYIFAPVIGENGEVEAVAGTTRDITDRMQAESRERENAAALRESAERFRLLVESVPEIAWTARPDGFFDYHNERFYETTGRERENDGESWGPLMHPDDREKTQQAWAHSIVTGNPYEIEMRLYHAASGEYRWFLTRARPLRDADGQIMRWFGVTSDIHEQKRIQQTLAVTSRLGATLGEDLDPERIVQALTDASTEAVGAEFGSFFYAKPDHDLGPDGQERFGLYVLSGAPREAFSNFPSVRTTSLFAPTFRGTGVVRSDDVLNDPRYSGMPKGHLPVRSYLAVTVRSRDGSILGGLLFGHSEPGQFTEEHERLVGMFAAQASVAYENAILYARLQNAKDELEQKVRERTADLQSAIDALQGFTYHVSHDLRAPLRSIVSTSRIVQEDFGEALPAEAHELLERQAGAATKLGRLIDDLLKLSRLSRAEIQKKPLDLTALARDAAHDAVAVHPETQVTIQVADGLTTSADPNLLRLAVNNLVENAVKYSPQGGTVRVGRRADGAFFVSDEGIGIHSDYFGKIFEPFERLHRDDEFEGTGIGLSNVRQVVERHGGRVWVESEPGRGSTFLFTLE